MPNGTFRNQNAGSQRWGSMSAECYALLLLWPLPSPPPLCAAIWSFKHREKWCLLIQLWIKNPCSKRVIHPSMGRKGPFSDTVCNCWMHLCAHLKPICTLLPKRAFSLSSQVLRAAGWGAGYTRAPLLNIRSDFFPPISSRLLKMYNHNNSENL